MAFRKIDSQKIALIKDLRAKGFSHDEIAERVGISKHTAIKYSSDVMPANEEEITNSIEGDAMGKMKLDLNKILNKAATEAVETAFEKQMEPPEEPTIFEPSQPSVLEAFFGGETSSTINIYKVTGGSSRFLGSINPAIWQTWNDVEVGFRDFVQQRTTETKNLNDWGNGVYLLKTGSKSRMFEIGALALPEKAITVVKPSSTNEEIEKLTAILKAVKEITPSNNSGDSTYKLLYEHQQTEIALLREELRSVKEKDINDEISKALSLAKLIKGNPDSSPWIDALRTFMPDLISIGRDIVGTLSLKNQMMTMPSLAKATPPTPALPVQFQGLFDELRGYIMANDSSKFPEISRKLIAVFGSSDDILKGLAISEISIEKACELLIGYYQPFKDIQGQLSSYMTAYVGYLRMSPYKSFYEEYQKKNQPAPSTQSVQQPSPYSDSNKPTSTNQPDSVPFVTVKCSTCGIFYDVEKEPWMRGEDDKVCGAIGLNGQECSGQLVEVKP